jgi:hypothetical protein
LTPSGLNDLKQIFGIIDHHCPDLLIGNRRLLQGGNDVAEAVGIEKDKKVKT